MGLAGTQAGMANKIKDECGFPMVTPEIIQFCEGVIAETLTGVATYANVPSGHTITEIEGNPMGVEVANAMSKEVQETIQKFCTGISNHIVEAALVTYQGPPPSPPHIPPSEAWWANGTISGLDGNAMALKVQAEIQCPLTPQLIGMCTGIANHIMETTIVERGVLQ